MRAFEYSDEKISQRELLIALPSMLIASGVLSLPKALASRTIAADGWIPLLIGGIIATVVAVSITKVTTRFNGETFYSYAAKLVTKPVAWMFTIMFCFISIAISALEVREIADISQNYLFNRTPLEVVGLSFLLVVSYAVAGSRAGILRLNIMFLPIILIIFIFLLALDIKRVEIDNLLPVFQTDWQDYIKAMPSGVTSYIGFGIIWFYISLVQKPQKMGRKVAKVMCIPIGVYLLVYLACVGVFGNMVTSNLVYPVVELAKEAELPGGIFERFESLFFVVWVMAIFNTTAMAFDIAVYALNMLFKKVDKHKFVFALAPIIFIISMTPHNTESVRLFATGLSYFAFSFSLLTLVLFAIAIKVKGVKGNG